MDADKEVVKTKLKEYFGIVGKILQMQEKRIKALEIKNGMENVEEKSKLKVPGSKDNGGRPEVCVKEGSNEVSGAPKSCERRNGKGSECSTKVPCTS